MTEPRPRLYFTPDHERFFLVPPEVRLPPGEVALRTLQGTSEGSTEEALAPWEVEREEARAHVDAGWERTIGAVRDSLRGIFRRAGVPAREEATPDTPPDLSRWPGGATPGEVLLDPERRREARRNVLRAAGRLVGGVDDERLGKVEQRLDRLGEQVRTGAAEVRQVAEQLSHEVQERAPAVERSLGDVGRGLAELGQRLVEGVAGRKPVEERTGAPPDEPEPEPEAEDR